VLTLMIFSLSLNAAGVRASIYNAITEGEVERLVDYITEFIQAEKDT
jgi:phosphoserine aminotransferase